MKTYREWDGYYGKFTREDEFNISSETWRKLKDLAQEITDYKLEEPEENTDTLVESQIKYLEILKNRIAKENGRTNYQVYIIAGNGKAVIATAVIAEIKSIIETGKCEDEDIRNILNNTLRTGKIQVAGRGDIQIFKK